MHFSMCVFGINVENFCLIPLTVSPSLDSHTVLTSPVRPSDTP